MTEYIELPKPQLDLDFPLMKALKQRRSIRKWSDSAISNQNLSNLLWAACGINKEATARTKCKRTAPSACNAQEISVLVAREDGVYLYDENEHRLILKKSIDVRELISTQKMMHSAPIGLIYVVNYSKMKMYLSKDDGKKQFTAGTDTGFISQNVYLYCAATGLSTVIIGLVNREKLAAEIGLTDNEHIVYTQVVGNACD